MGGGVAIYLTTLMLTAGGKFTLPVLLVISASIFLLAFATSFVTAFLACMCLGVGAMSLNTVGNTLIPVVLFEGKEMPGPFRAGR